MANTSVASLALIFAAISAISLGAANDEAARKPYIIHMVKSVKPNHFTSHQKWYASLLDQVSQSDPELLYIYDTVLYGFAAALSSAEAEAMESMDGCLAVIPSSLHQVATTHSPEFLGLAGPAGLWSKYSVYGKDIIVGVINTGIWPESKSFNDKDLEHLPPGRWNGTCQVGQNFTFSNCNNKIIGARCYFKGYEKNTIIDPSSEYKSPRDSNGHGTHVASIVAGAEVNVTSWFANGTARGMAPRARLAIYKVCWEKGCDDADIIEAIEQAVIDRVDIISMSIDSPDLPFQESPIAMALFKAIEKGVFVSASAGNYGPSTPNLTNTAPWITTVGASSIDRDFPASVMLGNGATYDGTSTYKGADGKAIGPFPLVYATATAKSKRCLEGSLNPKVVKGNIVLCDQLLVSKNPGESNASDKGSEVARARGVGMIVANEEYIGSEQQITDLNMPSISVSFRDGESIKSYLNTTLNSARATINITGWTVVGIDVTAPRVAAFSSRGPSKAYPLILKPDMIAPGVNILAAVEDGFEFMSGTSMAAPHVTGVVALIKAMHPLWSPAAIKSSLVTSSSILDNRGQPINDSFTMRKADPFAMGAGHINPEAAVDPGLVYNIEPQDYINFLCALNYTKRRIALLTNEVCSDSSLEGTELNYPSFSVDFKSREEKVQVKNRTVRYVGRLPDVTMNAQQQNLMFCPKSGLEAVGLNHPTWSFMFSSGNKSVEVERRALWSMAEKVDVEFNVTVNEPPGVKIRVKPQELKFRKLEEKVSYHVTFERVKKPAVKFGFGQIQWKCIKGGNHTVRSPVVIKW